MNEIQLKYGCNPNQKPSRIFMEDGSDLPVKVLNGRPGYINFLDAFNGDMKLERSIYETLQILGISLTDKTHLRDLFDKSNFKNIKELNDSSESNLFNF